MSDPVLSKLVLRYERQLDTPDEYTCDVVWIDRTTGREVMRYDGADPANTSPAYGAPSDEECFRRKGLDIKEEVDVSACVVRIPDGEAERHARAKERAAEREREEAEARELLAFLGDEAAAFDFADYQRGEREILEPALARRGFTGIAFYMIEQDSFGPLIRGCVATDSDGKRVRFLYG